MSNYEEIRIKFSKEDGELKIDVLDMFRSLKDEHKVEVAKALALDEQIIRTLCAWIVADDKHSSVMCEEPDWFYLIFPSEMIEKARLKLIPLMGKVERELIADLVQKRDHWENQSNQWRELCWDLKQKWNDKKRIDSEPIDYSRPDRLTIDQVEKLILRKQERADEVIEAKAIENRVTTLIARLKAQQGKAEEHKQFVGRDLIKEADALCDAWAFVKRAIE